MTNDTADLRTKLRDAIGQALGEDNGIHHERLADIHKSLSTMWKSLVKNRYGLVGVRTLRYAVHRYFLQTFAMSFVGLEPQQNSDTLEEAQILTQHVPEYLRAILGEKATSYGFSVEDAVALIATLESLVADDGRRMLQDVYQNFNVAETDLIHRDVVPWMLDLHMTKWIMGRSSSHWGSLDPRELESVQLFNRGQLRNFEYNRFTSSQTKRPWSEGSAWKPFDEKFSFEDVSMITDSMHKSFGEYSAWYCSAVKETLGEKDAKRTGRVRLGDFHKAALDGNAIFGESKAYLREMGALDETSSSLGPQVIITNYVQASSNCIVNNAHYRVCCQNECEGIFAELEEAIGGPLATPAQLLGILANMTGSIEEDQITIDPYLVKQLDDIARASQGKVPLHGRLFAQWLHYAFPYECPFPHKAGTTRNLKPEEFSGYLATSWEMQEHSMLAEQVEQEGMDDTRMSQWTPEEELLADYAHLRAPWEVVTDSSLTRPFFLLFIGIIVVGYKYMQQQSGKGLKGLDLPMATKAHYI